MHRIAPSTSAPSPSHLCEAGPRAKLLASAKRLAALTAMCQAAGAALPISASAAKAGAKGSRGGTSAPAYPPRVQAVLDYLDEHPMRVQSTPMVYEADVSSAHLPAVVQGLTPVDVMPPASQRKGVDPTAADHFARVLAGLLYTACGGLDQAHNLVTPLCWGAPTPYAGRPIPGSPAAQDAAYVHALVHRSEGLCDGEFGSGFSNANYWYAATGPHPIQPSVLAAMRRLAAGNPSLERLAANHGDTFSPSKFVAACSEAAGKAAAASRKVAPAVGSGSGFGIGHGGNGVTDVVGWVEGVMAAEFRALVEHSYKRLADVA